jgi:DNA-binding XRE family transcriptional regulator
MELAERLKELRKEKQLTQQEVAERVFMDRTLITKYENGTLIPTGENLEKLSVFYGIPVSQLVGVGETSKITISNQKFIKNFRFFISILGVVIPVCFVVLSVLPIFKYGKYVYPVPYGQLVPDYKTGYTSILNATLETKNPITLIAIILSMFQCSLSFSCLLPIEEKFINKLRLIQNIVFVLFLVFAFFSFAFGVSGINNSGVVY